MDPPWACISTAASPRSSSQKRLTPSCHPSQPNSKHSPRLLSFWLPCWTLWLQWRGLSGEVEEAKGHYGGAARHGWLNWRPSSSAHVYHFPRWPSSFVQYRLNASYNARTRMFHAFHMHFKCVEKMLKELNLDCSNTTFALAWPGPYSRKTFQSLG